MKKMILAVLAFTAIAGTGCSAARTAAGSDAATAKTEQIGRMLEARLYKIDFDRAYPATAPSFALNDFYFLTVAGDRVESFLPYYGRSYSAMMGGTGEEGLRFEAPITQYVERRGRGGRWDISLRARTEGDTYNLGLRISPSGECNLTVTSMRKQSISFTGSVDMDPEFEPAVRRAE